MTDDKYHAKETNTKTLGDLYQVVKSIDERVEEILEELTEGIRTHSMDRDGFYGMDDYLGNM